LPPGLKKFIQSWLINTLAVLIAVYLVKGIHYEKPLDLVVASLLLGILNAVLRPVLMFLALPLLLFTLGLFTLVINALLLYFVGYVLRPHFYVDGFLVRVLGRAYHQHCWAYSQLNDRNGRVALSSRARPAATWFKW